MIKITREKVVRFPRSVSSMDPLLVPTPSSEDTNLIDELGVRITPGGLREAAEALVHRGRGNHMRRTLSTAVETAKIFILLLLESAGETKNPGRPGA